MNANTTETSRPGREQQRDVAYSHLRQLLILSQLTPGMRLREPEWATRIGVNRAALREAFARLEAEGMLERGPLTGYFVPRFSDHEIAEIVKVRLTLEILAVRELCALPGDISSRLQPLRKAVEAFELMLEQNYIMGAFEADRRFHEELIRATGMTRLEQVYRRAPLPMFATFPHTLDTWTDSERRTIADHRAIIDALELRDPEAAIAILTRHLSRSIADA
jgi:DNA-binding GntR family transcriptional regulator